MPGAAQRRHHGRFIVCRARRVKRSKRGGEGGVRALRQKQPQRADFAQQTAAKERAVAKHGIEQRAAGGKADQGVGEGRQRLVAGDGVAQPFHAGLGAVAVAGAGQHRRIEGKDDFQGGAIKLV